MRKKAKYWIEKNKLNIIPKDPEYKLHIQSIDAFIDEDYERSLKLSRKAFKKYKSHMTLRLPR
jgi:hypothetical protein